jgi:lysophospholipase L1-like esterase
MAHPRYVALGSSFASGPGIRPVIDRTAGRPGRNYAHLLAQDLGADLTDATVGGATTANVLDTPQRQLWRTYPPQIDAVHPDADLVTVTAGGNDLGYIGAVLADAMRNRLLDSRLGRPLTRRRYPERPLEMPTAEQIAAATDGLVRIVDTVRTRAPRGRVVLVHYLPLFDEAAPDYDTSQLHAEQEHHHQQVAAQLSEVFATAGRRSGADVVGAEAYGPGHGLGSPDPWVNSLSLRHLLGSYHPNAAGMRAVADAIRARL